MLDDILLFDSYIPTIKFKDKSIILLLNPSIVNSTCVYQIALSPKRKVLAHKDSSLRSQRR